jgi:hypothetical protein
VGTIGGLLWTRQWTFPFHKIFGNTWVAEWLTASQEGFNSKELVRQACRYTILRVQIHLLCPVSYTWLGFLNFIRERAWNGKIIRKDVQGNYRGVSEAKPYCSKRCIGANEDFRNRSEGTRPFGATLGSRHEAWSCGQGNRIVQPSRTESDLARCRLSVTRHAPTPAV